MLRGRMRDEGWEMYSMCVGALLEKCRWISLYVTDDAIAKLYVP